MNELADAAAALGAETPDAVMVRIVHAVTTTATPGPVLRRKLHAAASGPVRPLADRLADAWEQHPHTPPDTVVAFLTVAAKAAAAAKAAYDLDVVWTGPQREHVSARRHVDAFRHVTRRAQEHLLVSTFSASDFPDVVTAVTDAMVRGVQVDFVIETTADNTSGSFYTDARDRLGHHLAGARWFRWTDRPAGASMHAKVTLADDHTALVTSANLSTTAYADSLEVGVLVTGGHVPAALRAHFDLLIRNGAVVPYLT